MLILLIFFSQHLIVVMFEVYTSIVSVVFGMYKTALKV